MRLALFQPDQPQNTGTILRLGACMGAEVHIIEPCGFPFSVKALRRAAMDYVDHVTITRHVDFSAFEAWRARDGGRLALLTTRASIAYTDTTFRDDDILLVGQESAGAPPEVHDAADMRLIIPMRPALRSLNVALSAAMVLGEAIRQTGPQT